MADKPIYIGGDDFETYEVGDFGFLIETYHDLDGWRRWELEQHPATTNLSHERRLFGWCGTTNNTGVRAHGMAKVVDVKPNGRARVELLEGDDLREALEGLGYPELEEEMEES